MIINKYWGLINKLSNAYILDFFLIYNILILQLNGYRNKNG